MLGIVSLGLQTADWLAQAFPIHSYGFRIHRNLRFLDTIHMLAIHISHFTDSHNECVIWIPAAIIEEGTLYYD